MQLFRSLAFGVLRTAARLAPASSRRWADAMLGELEEVDGDLPALLWALGGATALCRHSLARMHPVPRFADRIASRRYQLVIAGVMLLLAVLAMARGGSVSESRPASSSASHIVSAGAP
jgi:hypothetical protein